MFTNIIFIVCWKLTTVYWQFFYFFWRFDMKNFWQISNKLSPISQQFLTIVYQQFFCNVGNNSPTPPQFPNVSFPAISLQLTSRSRPFLDSLLIISHVFLELCPYDPVYFWTISQQFFTILTVSVKFQSIFWRIYHNFSRIADNVLTISDNFTKFSTLWRQSLDISLPISAHFLTISHKLLISSQYVDNYLTILWLFHNKILELFWQFPRIIWPIPQHIPDTLKTISLTVFSKASPHNLPVQFF